MLGTAVAVLASLGSGAALAAPLPVELRWQAPPECPQKENVLARIRTLLGSTRPSAPAIQAEGDIELRDGSFELRLVTEQEGRRGERQVRSAQCDDLAGVAAVALTLLLTSNAAEEPADGVTPTAPNPAPAAAPQPATDPTTTPDTPTSPADEGARGVRFLLSGPELALGFGSLPRPSVGFGGGVGVEGSWWSLRVLGQGWKEQRLPSSVEGYGANVQRLSAGFWGCTVHGHQLSVSPCVRLSLSKVTATGYGPNLRPESQSELVWGAGAGLIGRAKLTNWLALMVGIGGQVELSRPVILLGTIGRVRQLGPASATLLIGPEWIF